MQSNPSERTITERRFQNDAGIPNNDQPNPSKRSNEAQSDTRANKAQADNRPNGGQIIQPRPNDGLTNQ